jgi:hypothetical protein
MDHSRVPENGSIVDERAFSDLYIRTSWFDASLALEQIEKVISHTRAAVVAVFFCQIHYF